MVHTASGVLTAIDPTGVVGSSAGFFDVHDRFTWTPFGARFILPLPHDRFELSAGGGGAYERYTGNTGNETPVFYGCLTADGAATSKPRGRRIGPWTPLLVGSHSAMDAGQRIAWRAGPLVCPHGRYQLPILKRRPLSFLRKSSGATALPRGIRTLCEASGASGRQKPVCVHPQPNLPAPPGR